MQLIVEICIRFITVAFVNFSRRVQPLYGRWLVKPDRRKVLSGFGTLTRHGDQLQMRFLGGTLPRVVSRNALNFNVSFFGVYDL